MAPLKKFRKDLVALSLSVLFILAVLEVFLRLFYPQVIIDECTDGDYIHIEGNGYTFSKDFGWTTIPNQTHCIWTDKGVHGTATHNNKGLRMNHDILVGKSQDKKRIALFGDSFAYGYGNDQNDTLSFYLQQMFGDDWELLNFGASGYGTDNVYMRYTKEGRLYHPDVVVFLTYSNDPGNILFTEYQGYAKPIFKVNSKGNLITAENQKFGVHPLQPRTRYLESTILERHSHLYIFLQNALGKIGYKLSVILKGKTYKIDPSIRLSHPLGPEDSSVWLIMKNYTNLTDYALTIHFKILDRLVQEVKNDNATFVLANVPGLYLFNDREDMESFLAEFDLHYDDVDFTKPDKLHADYAKSRDVLFVPFYEKFKANQTAYIPKFYTGHYNGEGNQKMAEILYEKIRMENIIG